MSSQLKPIKLYGVGGPNPPKVAMVLEELGLPYEPIFIPLSDVKGAEYTKINPNGRIPSIYDPNTDLTLWESGAIVLYLVERYDTDHKISFPRGSNEAFLAQQWLFFQASGQGPYYGQSIYFSLYHHEKVPSTVERFNNEINRVTGVLEGYLAKQNQSVGPWLVGEKYSYADLAWINWQLNMTKFLTKVQFDPDQFPHVKKWLDNMTSRAPIKSVWEENERVMKEARAKGQGGKR